MTRLFLHALTGRQCMGFPKLSVEIIAPVGNRNLNSATSLPTAGPALELAVSELEESYSSKFSVRLTYVADQVRLCPDFEAEIDALLSDYYYRRQVASNVTVFVFAGCLSEGVAIARLAAGWNQLVMIGGYSNDVFRNRALYPNIIQASPAMLSSIAATIHSFIRKFGWKTLYVICDRSGIGPALYVTGAEEFVAMLRSAPETGYAVYYTNLDSRLGNFTKVFNVALESVRRVARVVSFWGHASSLRHFMIQANHMNMTSPDYVYICLDVYEYPTWVHGNYTWQNSDDDDAVAFQAFQALFMVSPTPALAMSEQSSKQGLLAELVERSQRDYNYTYRPSAMILDKALSDTLYIPDLSRSVVLAESIAGHAFETRAGEFVFDNLGARIVRFDVRQLNESTGILDPVLRQQQESNQTNFESIKEIRWNGDSPSADKPACGFSGFSGICAKRNSEHLRQMAITGCLVAVALLVFVAVFYRFLRKTTSTSAGLEFKSFDVTAYMNFERQFSHTSSYVDFEVQYSSS